MAEKLMDKEFPTVDGIKHLYLSYAEYLPSVESLEKREKELRTKLNDMLNKGKIDLFPVFKEDNELIQILSSSNNIKEFKYD